MITPDTEPYGRIEKEPKLSFRKRNLVLLALLFSPILIVLGFYAEEDLAGALIFSNTQARWEAQGESFDPKVLVPPLIPDEENLGALPIFKLSFSPRFKAMLPVQLHAALVAPINFFPIVDFSVYEPPDLPLKRSAIAGLYRYRFPSGDSSDPLTQLNALYPIWQKMVAESQTRTKCRFDIDYLAARTAQDNPDKFMLDIFALGCLGLEHGLLGLDCHQSSLAVRDISLLLELASGAASDGKFRAETVQVCLRQSALEIILEGLKSHSWDDSQLQQIQKQLESITNLADCQHSLRGLLILDAIPRAENYKSHPENFQAYIINHPGTPNNYTTRLYLYLATFWPSGWWDYAKANVTKNAMTLIKSIHPEKHKLDMPTLRELETRDKARPANWQGIIPLHIPAPMAHVKGNCWAQAIIDEALIACALERYYLMHKSYPSTLEDQLSPFCPQPLPRDIISGKPYIYRLIPDGTFRLYSSGWTEVDHGGDPMPNKKLDDNVDKYDWVWPGHG